MPSDPDNAMAMARPVLKQAAAANVEMMVAKRACGHLQELL
jgi:hypothetical protein